jgi:O-antigen ligase
MIIRRPSLSAFSYFLGFFALIFIMLVPAVIYKDMALISADLPPGVSYFLWPPGFFIVDVILLVFVYWKLLTFFSKEKFRARWLLSLLVGAIFLLLAMALQFSNGYYLQYYDGLVFALRLLIIFVILLELTRHNYVLTYKFFAVLILLLFLGSSAAFLLFGVKESLAGRYNLVGMGPNVSCDVIAMVYSISLLLYRKKLVSLRWLIVSLIPLILFIPFSGSRRAFFFAFILIFLTLNAKARVAMIGSLLGCAYFIIKFYALTWDDALSSVTSIIRVLETLEQINSGMFEDGRVEMYRTSINTILSNPFGVGLSDWAIQSEMSVHGVGSHSHNFFLQIFLKFGLISVFIFCFFIYCCYFLVKNKYWFHILYFFIGLNTGYGFWNLKYCTIFIWLCLSLSVLAQPISRHSRERLSL